MRTADVSQPLTIGIVGGMSPESTIAYYQHIVRKHQQEMNDHGYPRIVISSVSFEQYIQWQHAAAWDQIAFGLEGEFHSLARAGADFALLATNTMHKVLPVIDSPIPILSVLDAVTAHAQALGIQTVGLTGTKFTMNDGFYAQGLEDRGLTVILPSVDEQREIHRIIYEELIRGRVEASSIDNFMQIAKRLYEHVDAVLLGCTELELLTRTTKQQMRMLDSTLIHANAAWKVSIGSGPAQSRESVLRIKPGATKGNENEVE